MSTQTLDTLTTTYGYATGNNLQATESVAGTVAETYGYTADGRLSTIAPGISSPSSSLITSLTYNQEGRLSAVNSGSSALATYTYDGFGQRAIKTISGATGSIYKYSFNGQLLEEQNSSSVAQADYIYLNGQPIAVLNGSTLYFLHDDHLGTPQLATSTTHSVTSQANYQPFGAASVSGTITQNLRLPGQFFDQESGWNHNGFRDYMPSAGRYLEPDPLGFAGSGTNLYAYAGADPIDWSDPLGLKKCAGTARVLQGNSKLIGRGGAFNGNPSNLIKYGVTADSAAIVPFQFGQSWQSMRQSLEDVYGSVSGTYPTVQYVNRQKIVVQVPYSYDFSDVHDQIDDARTSAANGFTSILQYQQWAIKREGGNLLIELPGAPHDGGIGKITINVPDNWRCPCGTSEVK